MPQARCGLALPLSARMDTIELEALYRYFSSLDPVANEVPKTVLAPGGDLPEKE